jgi:tetratricopeptide (TPR) repeat protein
MSDSHSTFIGPDGLSLEEARALQDKLLAGLSTSPIDDKINAAARLMLEGRHQDCMQAYAAIAAEHPEKRGTAEGQIGACQFFLGNFEQAIAHYEKAKELGEDAEMMNDNIQEAQEELAKAAAEAVAEPKAPATAPKAAPSGQGKAKQMTLILAGAPMAFGIAGIHRLYTGHILTGLLQLVTMGGCGLWQIWDIIQIVTGKFTDADGNPLVD